MVVQVSTQDLRYPDLRIKGPIGFTVKGAFEQIWDVQYHPGGFSISGEGPSGLVSYLMNSSLLAEPIEGSPYRSEKLIEVSIQRTLQGESRIKTVRSNKVALHKAADWISSSINKDFKSLKGYWLPPEMDLGDEYKQFINEYLLTNTMKQNSNSKYRPVESPLWRNFLGDLSLDMEEDYDSSGVEAGELIASIMYAHNRYYPGELKWVPTVEERYNGTSIQRAHDIINIMDYKECWFPHFYEYINFIDNKMCDDPEIPADW